jgi:hypothetical protein
MYIQGSSLEIQTPIPGKAFSHSMIALLPVLSPNSILQPSSSHNTFIQATKNSACILKILFFFPFLKTAPTQKPRKS